MPTPIPVSVSQSLLGAMGTRVFVYYQNRIPKTADGVVVVSNHRSFMDAVLLIQALERPVRIACHYYMSQTPILRELVQVLGCFPLGKSGEKQKVFFETATGLLTSRQWVGLFPEGGTPMVELTPAREVGEFQRGFAHLAFRVSIPNIAILPVAIASLEENVTSVFPIRLLKFFDASESLFDRPGLHPLVIYRRANVLIGRPYWITQKQRQRYHGKEGKRMATELTNYCQNEIAGLLSQG